MLNVIVVADENEAAVQVGSEDNVIALVVRPDGSGQPGWCLVISSGDILAEIRNRLANFSPLDCSGHQPPAISVLATTTQLQEVLR